MDSLNWMDLGWGWLNKNEQRSSGWHQARLGRLTGSNFGTAVGVSDLTTPDELADELAGIKKKERTKEEIEVMDWGTQHEDEARKWYEETMGKRVEEIGLVVPKWNPYLGVSVDGCVMVDGKEPWETPGMIEIKCPKTMYDHLTFYTHKCQLGWKPPKNYHNHIIGSHWCQIQGCLGIMGKKWCDYVVYCPINEKTFVEHIKFDRKNWDTFLLPKLQIFIEKKLKPRLKKQGIVIEMPI